MLEKLEIVAEDDVDAYAARPGDRPGEAENRSIFKGASARISVRVTVSWQLIPGAADDMPCLLQWWEFTDVPYPKAGTPALSPNTWTDLSRYPSQYLSTWRAAMGGGGKQANALGSVGCDNISVEIPIDDHPAFPDPDAYVSKRNPPKGKTIGKVRISRRLSGVVRVFSGCPTGSQASESWFQGVTSKYYTEGESGTKQVLYPPHDPPRSPTESTSWIDKVPWPESNPPLNPPAGQADGIAGGPGTVVSEEVLKQPHLPTSDKR